MRNKFYSLFIVFFSTVSFSQQSKIDSLLSLLKKDKEDTLKVIHLYQFTRECELTGNYGDGLNYGNKSLQLSLKLNFKKGTANAYNNVGNIYLRQADYPKALDCFLKALKIDEELNNKTGITKRLGNIGIVYRIQGDYAKALDYFFKALKMKEELGNKDGIAIQLCNIGNVYWNQADYPKAMDYYLKALKIDEELGNKKGIAEDLGNIGNVYSDEAEKITGNNISIRKDSLKQKSLYYYFKALKISEELGNKNLITIWLGNIGALYADIQKYSEAEKYLLNAIKIDQEIGDLNTERQFEEEITDLYTKTNRYQLAMKHYKKAMVLKDTIFSQENKKQLVRKEMNFEFNKKEALAKAEQDKKDAITTEEKRRQKTITYSISGGLFLVLLLALFIFRGYKQKQKANLSLAEKNKIIEEKNKDITDSINYAKRIQQAKLPSKELIYSALPDSFVLFKPKDIVSGDFYFFHKNEQTVFIVSADCTGHGVPGALMSMIGSEQLNDALAHSADTSEILRQLNKGIKNSLHQSDSDESTRDGMDIALCSVDIDNRVVKYAGANRPLWIIRNGQTAVEEIKATKKAIGGFTEDSQHFDSHEIKFEQGDTFYIFSDGYADTFSGQGSKKLTTKKFKEILLSIQHKTMKEQEQHLDSFIENWKAGTEQVDDILVIGVRL